MGLEPTASTLARSRSSQLSYTRGKLEEIGIVAILKTFKWDFGALTHFSKNASKIKELASKSGRAAFF